MQNFFHSFGTLSLAFMTLFSSHHQTVHVTPPVTHEIQNKNMVTANGSLSKYGQTVTFTFSFPKDGGKISGNIAGACQGPITGNYAGGELSGQAQASCPFLFTTFTGTGSFHADVNTNSNSLDLHAHVTAQGMTQDIDIPLVINNKTLL